MKINVNWDNIKDGYRGFERLAVAYVQSVFKCPTWKKTQETRDGNKDAVAIILGYKHSHKQQVQWWMEAKYSSERKYLTRYRLDATIVSAILEGNISRIIFVTNILINAKTIMDIRGALKNATHCEEVYFCSRYTLEIWLANNPEQYKEFFAICEDIPFEGISLADFFVTQEIEYFSCTNNRSAFRESLRELNKGSKYHAYFEVFSPVETHLYLKPAKDLSGLEILTGERVFLHPGENQIEFQFLITKDYGRRKDGKSISPYFSLGNLEIVSAKYIVPLEQTNSILNLPSQTKLLNFLLQKVKQFQKENLCMILAIKGRSGAGKSHTINEFCGNSLLIGENVFHIEFRQSLNYNLKALIHLILFILFPYISPIDIDEDYLNRLSNKTLTPEIIDFVKNRNDSDIIGKLIEQLEMYDTIFPYEMEIGKRIVILDDLQYLNHTAMLFLTYLIIDIQKRKLPIIFYLFAQPHFFETEAYEKICENCSINQYDYQLNLEDVYSATKTVSTSYNAVENLVYSLDFDIIELVLFVKYILNSNQLPSSLNDFLLLCKSFQQSEIKKQYILNQFRRVFRQIPDSRELCDRIYWACEPISPDSIYNDTLKELFSNGLIKYNHDAKIVPFHDIHCNYYRSHFPLNIKPYDAKIEEPEVILSILKNTNDQDLLYSCAKKTIDLSNKKKLHSVMYILEGIFETNEKEVLKMRIDSITYYQLYYAYCLAAGQLSIERSNGVLFTELYNEVRFSDNIQLLDIKLSALWELSISNYEAIEYEKVRLSFKEMISTLLSIQKKQQNTSNLLDNLRYHDIMMLDTLMHSNSGSKKADALYRKRSSVMLKKGFDYRYFSFRVRYALTLCVSNIDECLNILKECKEYFFEHHGSLDKYYLWSGYHYAFYSMIKENNILFLEEAKFFHNQLKKNQYANYRQRLNGMAAYYLSKGDLHVGSEYLLVESGFKRRLCRRQEAFRFMTMALYELLRGNIENAKESLIKTINMFESLKTYQIVPLHNLEVIEQGSFHPKRIYFYFGGNLNENAYYIDPRCAW